MFRTRWQLFRLRGIPIAVDASWLIILALVTWTLTGLFSVEAPGWPRGYYWLMGLVAAIAFFICIVLHELGHAVVAQRTGIQLRGVTLFLFGGVAEMRGEPTSAAREFAMAIAGPAVSGVLVLVFWLLSRAGAHAEWPVPVVVVLRYLAWINLTVLIFNLIPAFPLDGGRVLRSALWGWTGNVRRATYWASLAGQGFAWLLIAFGVLQFFAGNLIGGIWLGLIGMFLNNAAQGSYQQVIIRQVLRGEPVRRFMNPQPIVVPPTLDLQQWVDDYVYRYHHKTYPVAMDGRLEGVVATGALAGIPREEWVRHTVDEIMRRDLSRFTLSPDADALFALEKMQRTGLSRLVVTAGDQLVGIISLKDLMKFLQLKLELEGGEEADDLPSTEADDQEKSLTP